MAHLFIGNLVEDLCRGRISLAQPLGKAAINLAVFLFIEDRKSKDLPFGEIDKVAPCGPRDLENPLTQSGPRSRGVEQGLPCYIELGPPPRRCGRRPRLTEAHMAGATRAKCPVANTRMDLLRLELRPDFMIRA